jgi:NADH:ubiquinone oxidoreductase subunit 3 (subunit A)
LLSRQNVIVFLMFILLIIKLFALVYLLVFGLVSLFFMYGLFKHQLTRFECGFTGVGAVLKLSLNFFSILIVFIIFDLEIILLIGMVTKDFCRSWGLFLVWAFIFLGLYFE